MRFQTPDKFSKFAYFGIDTRALANIGDEFFGIGIGRLYAGIYPTRTGFEIAAGITDHNGCL